MTLNLVCFDANWCCISKVPIELFFFFLHPASSPVKSLLLLHCYTNRRPVDFPTGFSSLHLQQLKKVPWSWLIADSWVAGMALILTTWVDSVRANPFQSAFFGVLCFLPCNWFLSLVEGDATATLTAALQPNTVQPSLHKQMLDFLVKTEEKKTKN